MHEDGRVEHAGEFLLIDLLVFPNFKFVEALKAELDKDRGTVFMWSKHENMILTKIIQQFENVPKKRRRELWAKFLSCAVRV